MIYSEVENPYEGYFPMENYMNKDRLRYYIHNIGKEWQIGRIDRFILNKVLDLLDLFQEIDLVYCIPHYDIGLRQLNLTWKLPNKAESQFLNLIIKTNDTRVNPRRNILGILIYGGISGIGSLSIKRMTWYRSYEDNLPKSEVVHKGTSIYDRITSINFLQSDWMDRNVSLSIMRFIRNNTDKQLKSKYYGG